MFVVRPAEDEDLPALLDAARHLDSVNLPNDEARLSASIARSRASFAGNIPPEARELLFVLVAEGPSRQVIGSSMIFAQHGSLRAPHIFFDVIDEERYSETLNRHFHHKVLRLGSNYKGLTEIGGLVLLPRYRGHPEQLGKTLLLVRFIYIALHRNLFCDEMVSELMPPLEPDGTSLLWEALGRKFTGLSYQEADRLSRENKEFIRALFPQDPIYASLLPAEVQALIGQVGPHTKGVEKMLVRAGFEYAHRIDPFDGGPHFQARTSEVLPVKATGVARVVSLLPDGPEGGAPPGDAALITALLAVERDHQPFFQATRTRVKRVDRDQVAVPQSAAGALDLKVGDTVAVLPL